jgi:hypothetical protein
VFVARVGRGARLRRLLPQWRYDACFEVWWVVDNIGSGVGGATGKREVMVGADVAWVSSQSPASLYVGQGGRRR